MTIDLAFRAGFTRRWHTNPDLAHTNDRIDGHAGRVARIILMMHPSPSLELVRAALIHDDGESLTGDLPGPFKAAMPPEVGRHFDRAESAEIIDIWGRGFRLTGQEVSWLKFADRLDAFMWCAWHAPHCMNGDGWPECREWLDAMAVKLGVAFDGGEVHHATA